MPIYLVRWPGWVASLVSARDEFELEMILDQEASTEGVEWEEYNGPIAIDFAVNADFETVERRGKRDQLRIGSVARLRNEPFKLRVGGSEEAFEMMNEILWAAFPSLASVLNEAAEKDRTPLAADLRSAIRGELAGYLSGKEPSVDRISDPVEKARAERAKWKPGVAVPFRPRGRAPRRR